MVIGNQTVPDSAYTFTLRPGLCPGSLTYHECDQAGLFALFFRKDGRLKGQEELHWLNFSGLLRGLLF